MPTPDFTTFPIPTLLLEQGGVTTTGTTTIRTLGDRFKDDGINVKDFGAVGDNVADDTAAIQAAIDYAAINNIQTIRVPKGIYKISDTIWLDQPGNLRGHPGNPYPGSVTNPDFFAFSLALIGDGIGNLDSKGTQFRATFDNKVAIMVGPGQAMWVANFAVQGPGTGYHAQQHADGVGLGIAGGNGGAYRVRIDNIWVANFWCGFKTGANGNGALDDSNVFYMCQGSNLQFGFWIAQSQNFTNSFYNCNPGGAVGLFSAVGAGGHVFGGNYSAGNSHAACFSIGSIGPITATFGPNYYIYTFDGTIASPNAYVGVSSNNNTVYKTYVLKTARFGLIPLSITAYNSGTGVATFQISNIWSSQNYFGFDAVANADLQAEIQACTTLHCAEPYVTFWGTGISVHGIHLENAYAPTTLIIAAEGIGSNPTVSIRDVTCNWSPVLADIRNSSPGTAEIAKFYAQTVTPFIQVETTSVSIADCNFEQTGGGDPMLIQFNQNQPLTMRNMFQFGPVVGQSFNREGYEISQAPYGGGRFDVSPYKPSASFPGANGPGPNWMRNNQWGQVETWGVRPALWSRPTITPGQLTTLTGTLPAISQSAGNWAVQYPLLWGGQVYSVTDRPDFALPTRYEIISNHKHYTYGQDFTTTNVPGLTWSYKGQSICVYTTATMLEALFPGLQVILNDGVSDQSYMVTGVYPAPSLGYFTVDRQLSGNKTTIINGTTIKQEPFKIQIVSGQAQAVTKTADFTVAPLENLIIVNKGSSCTVTLPSAASYSGRSIKIKTIQAFTVVSASSNVIPQTGGAAGTAILAATAGKWAELTSNGSSWEIIQSN
jgi:Pectate lyase superfamily protein